MKLSNGHQPLYKQVYDVLVTRLAEGHWKLASPLPSEYALADELGVSQGTVRKALNQMVAENLLYRRQGKGTYVAEHTQESSLFRFFRFREPSGKSLVPDTQLISMRRRKVNKSEKRYLQLEAGSEVNEMVRLRYLQDKPTILETVIQPLSIFPELDKETDIPNSLYTLYQEKYGISIIEVSEELRAIKSNNEHVKLLNVKQGEPLFAVDRISFSINKRPVEWSQAYCSTENFVYSVSLR